MNGKIAKAIRTTVYTKYVREPIQYTMDVNGVIKSTGLRRQYQALKREYKNGR